MPIAKVQLPDGRIGRFEVPEGTTPEQVMAFVQDMGAQPSAEAPEPRNDLGAVGRGLNFVRGLTDQLTQGALFNLGDEVAAAGRFVGGQVGEALGTRDEPGKSFGEALQDVRGEQARFREENPVAATAANVVGGLGAGAQAMKSGLTLMNAAKPTIPSMALRGAGEGALYGAAYGAGEGEGAQDRLARALQGGTVGALTGGALGAASGAVARSTAPTTQALRAQADAAYEVADRSGVRIAPQSLKSFVDTLPSKLDDAGFDEVLHPRVARALKVAQDRAEGPMTLSQAERLRRVVKNAASSPDASERNVARVMVDELDDYISTLGQADVLAGNAADAQALSQARDFWARKSKAETVQGLTERARNRSSLFTGSGYENALRTEFRNLVQNEKKMRLFTKSEQEALRKVAQGGPIGNAMRFLGRFAPRGPVSTGFGVGSGLAMGDPLVTGAVMMAGEAGRMGATAATARNARLAEELMRAGGQGFSRAVSPSRQALMRALMIGGAQQGARMPLMMAPAASQ